MALMKTSNPALGEKTFQDMAQSQYGTRYGGYPGEIASRMTLNGTVNKTGLMLVLAIISAGWTWHLFTQSQNAADVMPWKVFSPKAGLDVFMSAIVFPLLLVLVRLSWNRCA